MDIDRCKWLIEQYEQFRYGARHASSADTWDVETVATLIGLGALERDRDGIRLTAQGSFEVSRLRRKLKELEGA